MLAVALVTDFVNCFDVKAMVGTTWKVPLICVAILLSHSIPSQSQKYPRELRSIPDSLEAFVLPIQTALRGTSNSKARSTKYVTPGIGTTQYSQ